MIYESSKACILAPFTVRKEILFIFFVKACNAARQFIAFKLLGCLAKCNWPLIRHMAYAYTI